MLPDFSYIRVKTVKEAIDHLGGPGTRIHGGGTDLLGCLRDEIFPADKLVSLQGIDTLGGIRETPDGGLRLGALATIADIADSPLVRGKYPGLSRAAREVASPQLRRQGTIGGNLCQKPRCWYYRGEFHCLRKGGDRCFAVIGENQFHCILGGYKCFIVHPSDPAPMLLALKADVRIEGPDGAGTAPLESFHVSPRDNPGKETILGPREVVTEILIPAPEKGLKTSYRKIRTRQSWDFSIAGVALALTLDGKRVTGGRVCFSGVAPVPWRAREVEEVIHGKELTAETISQATRAAVAEARPLKKNAYKVPLLKAVLQEELEKIVLQ